VLKAQGFTLIELLVIVALLAVMATVAVLSLDSTRSGAEEDATRYEMSVISKALSQFKNDVRHFPDAAQKHGDDKRLMLLTSCQDIDDEAASYDEGCAEWDRDLKRGWNGPYLSGRGDKDAWGNPYLLLAPEDDAPGTGAARLVSTGENGKYEGENATDPCLKFNDASDDIVLCLVQ
jgi:general secretion pathway protein G